MTEQLGKSIVAAVRETITAIGGGSVAASGEPAEGSSAANGFEADTSVIISVVGQLNGAFALRCNQTLAASLAGLMLGIEIEPGSEDMTDAVGELFNMIVGAMKRYLASTGDPFSMSVPTTIVGKDYTVYINANDNTKVMHVPLTIDGLPMAIESYTNE